MPVVTAYKRDRAAYAPIPAKAKECESRSNTRRGTKITLCGRVEYNQSVPSLTKTRRRPDQKQRVGFVSLGCAKNLVDSEVMLGILSRARYEITGDIKSCDVAIVNTCGFIENARKESIAEILALADLKTSGKIRRLIVSGCLAQKYAKDLSREIPEIDALIGTGEYHKIDLILERLDKRRRIDAVSYPDFLYDHMTPRLGLTPSYSRYIKIAEGCNHTCSFCIIPQMRGSYRSRPVSSIVDEVHRLAREGLKEVNLISQETTYYGRDIDRRHHLPELLRALDRVKDIRWIRLFYCHPQHMTSEIIDAVATSAKVLPYIDLPLQHINDRILTSMRRGVTKAKTVRLLEEIRRRIPDAVLRTTFIVGYPGESDEEFKELCRFVSDTAFNHVGVFTFSRERDVSSGALPHQLPERVKNERFRRVMELQQPISLRHNQKKIGQNQTVLIEHADQKRPGWYRGRLAGQAPGVDGEVWVDAHKLLLEPGAFVSAHITDAMPYDLLAMYNADANI